MCYNTKEVKKVNTVILTSCLDLYEKDKNGNKIPHNFGNENGILDCLKKELKNNNNFLFVARGLDDERTWQYYENTCKSFEITLPFKTYNILNNSTKSHAKELVKNADLIFLCGGHLPTQNKFFNDINLKDLLKNTNALIVGGSAGSMNCADIVYCPPEIEGESNNPHFKKYLKGLGFTKTNILPHFQDFKDFVLDGKNYLNDIILPDSYKTKIVAINDGTYIVIKNGKEKIFGEYYIIENGTIK